MVGVSYGGALALALGYCLGSIPFGLVLTKLSGAGDLRSIGSGNIGATNVLRTGRKGLAAATLVLDALEGDAGDRSGLVDVRTANGACCGGRRGPRPHVSGLAASSAAARASLPILAVSSALRGRRRSCSLSSGSLSRRSCVIRRWRRWLRRLLLRSRWRRFGESGAAVVFAALSALVWFKHSANIVRLLNGSESKIGQKTRVDGEQA